MPSSATRDEPHYISFPSIEAGGGTFGDGVGGTYTLPRLLDRFRSALGGTAASPSLSKDNKYPVASADRNGLAPKAGNASPTSDGGFEGSPESRPVASGAPVGLGHSTSQEAIASTPEISRPESRESVTTRRNSGLPFNLSNTSQTPSVGLSPISTSVVQHAMGSSGWASNSRSTQVHSFQFPRPQSASSRYTGGGGSLARVPQSPAHSYSELLQDSTNSSDKPNHFSDIPGFPINRDAADDAGSIVSTMTRGISHPGQTSEAASRLFRRIHGVGLSKDYWMPDEDAKECYDCASRFTAWRRKHHCRVCGQIFCSTCASNLISGYRLYASGFIRVCNICLARLNVDTDDAGSEALEGEAPHHPLASSWATPSLPSLRLLPSQSKEDIAGGANAQDHHPPRRRTPDYIVHSRDLSGDHAASVIRPRWDDSDLASGLAPSALHSPNPAFSGAIAPSPVPAPFRPATVEDDQPTADPSGAVVSFVDDDFREGSEDSSAAQQAIKQDANGVPDRSPIINLEWTDSEATHATDAVRTASTSALESNQEALEVPAHVRARVISRPLLPRISTDAASTKGVDAKVEPPTSLQRLEDDGAWNDAELTPAAFAHLHIMVRQALQCSEIPRARIWETELLRLLAKVSRYPAPNVAAGDPADVRRIVKIKKIPGGTPADSEYVSGVVCTKNVLHKKMPRSVANPRVVLLDFSLDYERVEGRLTKLETLVSQEKTWLRSNVDKVLKLRPSVVLVQGNVPGYAVDLFVNAGVAVARNLRPGLIQAIARVTQTSANSMDKLAARPAYGQSGLFQVQTFVHSLIPGLRKTFIRIEGCSPDLGATLVLRGGTLAVLKRVKAIAEVMIRIAYSLKLESYYLRDEGVVWTRRSKHVSVRDQNAAFVVRRQRALLEGRMYGEAESDLARAETVIAPYEILLLSGSPSVSPLPPLPLQGLRNTLTAIRDLRQNRDAEEADRILREETGIKDAQSMSAGSPNAVPEPSSFILQVASDLDRDEALAHLESRKIGQMQLANAYLAAHEDDFALAEHQRLLVQECVTRRSDNRVCRGHQLRELRFYHPGEGSVGQTIQALVASRSEVCPTKGCGEPKQTHRTHYLHCRYEATLWIHHQLKDPAHPGEVDATLEPGNESLILMESFCQICDGYTPKTKMSDDSWRLSFGKFLELCFHSPGLLAGVLIDRNSNARLSCGHDAHLSHARHFFHRGFRVDLVLRTTNVFDARLPPTRSYSAPQAQLRLRNEEYSTVDAKLTLFFDSIRARIATFNYDLVPVDRQEKCREVLANLCVMTNADEKTIQDQLKMAYETAAGTTGLRINAVRKALVAKAVAWDTEFSSFEMMFLTSADKDTRRLSSMQIRKLFVDATVPPPERQSIPDLAGGSVPSEADVNESAIASALPTLPSLVKALDLPFPEALPLPDLPTSHLKPAEVSSGHPASHQPAPQPEGPATHLPQARSPHDPPVLRPRQGALAPTTPSIPGDMEGVDSDSTVTGGESHLRAGERTTEGVPVSTPSDTDTSSESALPVAVSRSRRVRPPASIAQLVQRFDADVPSGTEGPSRGTRAPVAAAQRPSFRRGKSESVRTSRKQGAKQYGSMSDSNHSHEVTAADAAGGPSEIRPSSSDAKLSRQSSRTSKSTYARSTLEGRPGSMRRHRSISTTQKRSEFASSTGGSTQQRPETATGTSSAGRAKSHTDVKGKEVLRRPRPEVHCGASASPQSRKLAATALSVGNGRVSTIARHFDRLSREADSDRSRRAGPGRSRRARPIGHAQSSVHAFSSLRAAVRGDSDDEDYADDEDETSLTIRGGQIPIDLAEADEQGSRRGDISPPHHPVSPELSAQIEIPLANAPTSDGRAHGASGNSSPPNKALPVEPAVSVPASPLLGSEGFVPPSRVWHHLSESELSSSDTTSRNSIMKTLSALWNFRGSDLLPLEYPQMNHEHQSAENPVMIREDEPTSIVAYTLSSRLYRETLDPESTNRELKSEQSLPEHRSGREFDRASVRSAVDGREHIGADDMSKISPTKPMQFRFDLEACSVTCKVFFMHQFESLRSTFISRERFVESLARCIKWDSAGGKSGQSFLKTKDELFVIKGISKVELEGLTKFAPAYFEYVATAAHNSRPTALAKIYGIFQISFVNKTTGKKAKLQVQVTENLWAEKKGLKTFDLKGLTRNRTAVQTGKVNEVLLDGNFIEMCRSEPVLVHETALLQMQAALFNDTAFLAACNHMDYSLIVGLDTANQELHVGIIDYLTPYGFNKRLETLVKELGGTGKEAPTVITPMLYKARFRSAMARYFTLSPDFWLTSLWTPILSKDSNRDASETKVEGKPGTERFASLRKLPVFDWN